MAGNEFVDFGIRLQKLAKNLSGPQMKAVLDKAGVEAKKDVTEAVRGDIGDTSMSNWRRGRPIDIGARFKDDGPDAIVILPASRSGGPMRVLEEGRKAGGSHDLILVGKARKDGTRRAKSRGRNQGATSGKNTWTEAGVLIDKRTPPRLLDGIHELMTDTLGGG